MLPAFAAQTISMTSILQDLQKYAKITYLVTLPLYIHATATFCRIIQTRPEDKTENTVANRALFVYLLDAMASVILKLWQLEYFSHCVSWLPSLYSILPKPERARICRLHESNAWKRCFKLFNIKVGPSRSSKLKCLLDPRCYARCTVLFSLAQKKTSVWVSPAVTLAQYETAWTSLGGGLKPKKNNQNQEQTSMLFLIQCWIAPKGEKKTKYKYIFVTRTKTAIKMNPTLPTW